MKRCIWFFIGFIFLNEKLETVSIKLKYNPLVRECQKDADEVQKKIKSLLEISEENFLSGCSFVGAADLN